MTPEQEDIFRRLVFRLFRDECHCAANVKDHQCVRCTLMWDARRAMPELFTAAAEIYTLSTSGKGDR